MSRAKVHLVGAGPGAADLLTVRAVKVLAHAEIVFHDALINKDILDYCAPECVIVPVGARGGWQVTHRQERIHQLLADAAAHYTTIVRLKGGDPCVFGRAGEEMEFLTAQGILWEVVPGISAGVGGLSLLGLPLTHRDLSSSVTLLTGSRMASGALEDLPLSAPLSASQTLVFYMPFRHLANIASRLLEYDMPPQTPAMCVSWLGYSQQTWVTTPLWQLGEAVAHSALGPPSLMVVGDVVGFWQHLCTRAGASEQV
ncbi:Uroporphyrinogen-III C-methyltransferase [Candidatus Entotheonellaceae bacterium PAL068K]